MAADDSHVKEASASFISRDEVFRESECQSCSHLKKDLQFLMEELKSMTEIINVLKDELVYKGAAKQDQLRNKVLEINPKINAIQCDNCSQLDNQLKIDLNELSSVKLITAILNEEMKTLKLTCKCTWKTDPDPFWSSVTSKRPRNRSDPRYPNIGKDNRPIDDTNRYAILTNIKETDICHDEIVPNLTKATHSPTNN